MELLSLEKELKENSYPGRGIVIGRSQDGTKAVTAYFIMGRSEDRESVPRHLTHQNLLIRALSSMLPSVYLETVRL